MNITLKRALSSLAVAFAIAPAFAQRDTVNVIDWQFSRSTLTPATATQGDGIWKAVRLPHDFLVEQPWVAPAKDEKADNSDLANSMSRVVSPPVVSRKWVSAGTVAHSLLTLPGRVGE